MSKASEQQEATTYRVQETGKREGSYSILKLIMGVEVDKYYVSLRHTDKGLETYCSCMGFNMQTYPHSEHKHVKIVSDYVTRGQPDWAEYKIIGAGRKAKFTFRRSAQYGPG